MIDFTTLQGLTIPEGVVTQITDESGRVIWAANIATDEPPAIFEVAKQTKTTYAGETKYENEEFILFDIYPKKGGTVTVTYGGLTKTITDTSGAENPNAQQVFFGTFNGVSDSVATPASGRLTIEGAYRGYGLGSFGSSSGKSSGTYAYCVTSVVDFGNPVYIGSYTFRDCTNIVPTSLPSGLTSIETYTFYGCTNLALTSLPSGITSIGSSAFQECYALNISSFPEGLVSIGSSAFYCSRSASNTPMYGKTITFPSTLQSIGDDAFRTSYYQGEYLYRTYLAGIVMLSETPPVLGGKNAFGSSWCSGTGTSEIQITVPKGCIEAYVAAEYWCENKGQYVEAS